MINYLFFLRLSVVCLCVGPWVLGGSIVTHAQDFAVAPPHIHLSPEERSQALRVTNRGDQPLEFRFEWVYYTMDENGVRQEAELPDDNVSQVVRFGPRALRVAPGETGMVRLFLAHHNLDQQYRAHLRVLSQSFEEIEDQPNTRAHLGLNFTFDVSVVVNPDAEVSPVQIEVLPHSNREQLELRLIRLNERAVWGNLRASVRGSIIGEVRGLGVYETSQSRHIVLPLQDSSEASVTLEFITENEVIMGEATHTFLGEAGE